MSDETSETTDYYAYKTEVGQFEEAAPVREFQPGEIQLALQTAMSLFRMAETTELHVTIDVARGTLDIDVGKLAIDPEAERQRVSREELERAARGGPG